MAHKLLMERFKKIDVYPVTCQELSLERDIFEVTRALIEGGAKVIQYREKQLSKVEKYAVAQELREITEEFDVLLIINDDVDIALAVNADGVHLGQDDLPCASARDILGADKLIGVSTHNLEEAEQAAEDGASYVNVGPIFVTSTKGPNIQPVGIETFEEIRDAIDLPITVMGGINETNIDQVLTAGARRVAMVSALVSQVDIAQATETMRKKNSRCVFGVDLVFCV